MTQEQIEGNILIDIFYKGRMLVPNMNPRTMGYRRGSSEKYWNYYDCCEVIDLKYHSSWDWLMPIARKVMFSTVNNTELEKNNNNLTDGLCRIDIDEVWLAIVEFIKWYNQNKQP